MRDKFRVNSMIVVPAAIIVLGIYIFQGLSITAPAQTQTIEWIKVIPYIIVLGTAIAGMNVMLVLIIGILTSGIIGIATGSFGIFDWFGAMGMGITGMGELIIITLLAGGMLETIRYNGGIDFIIRKLTRHVNGKRGAELSIAALVSIANLCTANNTIAKAPLGDFFGMGHGITKSFASAPLQITPEDGRGFNCWFPMPFRRRARFTVKNECCSPLHFYFYVDYEQVESLPENTLYFHALWNRECPTDGIPSSARSRHMEWIMGGEQDKHLSAEGNYVLLDAEGSGQYVGCNINIHNLENSSEWDWFGEGDDAILIDDEPWPPRLHGTGMEDYLGLAWCPTQEYHALYNGCTLSPMDNYKGMASYYRFHILDPIMFDRHIRVTFEHGHNNNRSDDWSTTAYWYQTEPHKPFHPMLPVEQRLPIDQKLYEWTGRREFCKNEENVR